MANILDYFSKLNTTGQVLFIIGILLVIVFVVLLFVVFKPEKKAKKVYGENELTDKERAYEKRLKDIDNICDEDINIDNDKTRNLKSIVDELKYFESKMNKGIEEKIEEYEKDEEATAVISLDELLNYKKPVKYEKRKISINKDNFYNDDIEEVEPRNITKKVSEPIEELLFDDDDVFEDISESKNYSRTSRTQEKPRERVSYDDDEILDVSPVPRLSRGYENSYKPKREVFSSVYSDDNDDIQSFRSRS